MGTNATIVVKQNGNYNGIYLHYDGYTSHALALLEKHYATQEAADKLIALGRLSVLAQSTDCPAGHTFETPVKGHCIAYGRDRGENNTAAVSYTHLVDSSTNYIYLFENNEWTVLCQRGILPIN